MAEADCPSPEAAVNQRLAPGTPPRLLPDAVLALRDTMFLVEGRLRTKFVLRWCRGRFETRPVCPQPRVRKRSVSAIPGTH